MIILFYDVHVDVAELVHGNLCDSLWYHSTYKAFFIK